MAADIRNFATGWRPRRNPSTDVMLKTAEGLRELYLHQVARAGQPDNFIHHFSIPAGKATHI
jgi:hypothetical protein